MSEGTCYAELLEGTRPGLGLESRCLFLTTLQVGSGQTPVAHNGGLSHGGVPLVPVLWDSSIS